MSRSAFLASILLALAISSCGGGEGGGAISEDAGMDLEEGDATEGPPEPVVFAVISDLHIKGDMDHSHSKNLVATLDELAGLDAAPEFVAVTGDLLDMIPEPPDTSEGSPIDTLKQIVAGSPLPVYMTTGNHDFYYEHDPQFTFVEDKEARDQLLLNELGVPEFRTVERGGVKFILLGSMEGPLWNNSTGLTGSFGVEQLEWLDSELSEGKPSLLFFHHPTNLLMEPEGDPTLEDVILDHPGTVLAVFVGHLHIFKELALADVPVYLTTTVNKDGTNHHLVRVDPLAGEVEILNREDIDYGGLASSSCDPAEEPALGDLEPFGGTVQEIILTGVETDAGGLGVYLEEAVDYFSFVAALGEPDPSGITGILTVGFYEGDGEGDLPAYVISSPDAPCLPTYLVVTDPCFQTQPMDLELDVMTVLPFDVDLPADWEFGLTLTELQISGRLAVDDDAGIIEECMLSAKVDVTEGYASIQEIIVTGYCDGEIEGCLPGDEGMPECPAEPTVEFLAEIPNYCDVRIYGFGLKVLLGLLDSVPGHKGSITAGCYSVVPVLTEEEVPGGLDPATLSTAPGGNCEGL